MKTVFVGLIPYAYDTESRVDNIYYLLGREACESGYSDSGLWSGFGGGPESTDSDPLAGAAREAYEESMGFLGDPGTIKSIISSAPLYLDYGNLMRYTHVSPETPKARAYIAPLPIRYDPNLPDLYIRVYDYIAAANPNSSYLSTERWIPKIPGRDGWYEKVEVDWFTLDEILSESDQMRPAFLRSVQKIQSLQQGPLF
jgi:hypothetical protein